MTGPLIRRVLAASGVLIVLVGLIFSVMLVAIDGLRTSGREARQAQETMAAANDMQTLVLGLESSMRGYVLTRQQAFLGLWRESASLLPTRATALERLVADDPPQRRRAEAIVADVDSYVASYSRPLIALAQRSPVEAAAVVRRGEGRWRIGAVRSRFAAFRASETAVSARQARRADASGHQAVVVGIAGLGAIVLLILACALYLARVVVVPVRRVAEAAKRLAAGDRAARAPEDGVGAIADLGIAFNAMVESLEASQAELEQFFTLSIDMLGVATMEGTFTRLNPAFERILGYTTDELQSRPFIEFVHPDDREKTLAEVAKLATGVQTVSFENRYGCKDGSYVWLTWTTAPNMESRLLYAAAHDVTGRKKAELEIAELNAALADRATNLERQNVELERLVDMNRALLDASIDGIRLSDLEGRTLLANSLVEQLRAEVFDLPPDMGRGEQALIADRLVDPGPYLRSEEAILADPEITTSDILELVAPQRAFHRHTGPVRNSSGELIGRIAVLREITAEREVARIKSELVATVSHELRTPLASVLGFAELLRYQDVDEQTRRHYIEIIDGEAQRLTALVDDFLDLEKIEAGRFTLALEPFDLRNLIDRQIQFSALQSSLHEIRYARPDESLDLMGDRNRIGQVVANLISNAIKYSPAGGPVDISTSVRDGFVRTAVSDAGIGIPPSQQANLFTRFFRVDSSDTREIGGTGLGLALCKEIVTAHCGRIGFDSREGEGSTFWFELPTARASASESQARVLVIEDDAARATLLVDGLACDDLAVEAAASGERGLARATADPPAAIVLDIALAGELDGWDVLERLESHAATAQVPVIMCCATAGRGAVATLGVADVVQEPFTDDQVREAVRRYLPARAGSILVVDHDQHRRRLVCERLTDDGFSVRQAVGGAEALVLIADCAPDGVVLDLLMPGVDGFAVLERLWQDEEMRDVPVIALTAPGLSLRERLELEARSTWLVQKREHSADELRRLVHLALGGRPARDSLQAA